MKRIFRRRNWKVAALTIPRHMGVIILMMLTIMGSAQVDVLESQIQAIDTQIEALEEEKAFLEDQLYRLNNERNDILSFIPKAAYEYNEGRKPVITVTYNVDSMEVVAIDYRLVRESFAVSSNRKHVQIGRSYEGGYKNHPLARQEKTIGKEIKDFIVTKFEGFDLENHSLKSNNHVRMVRVKYDLDGYDYNYYFYSIDPEYLADKKGDIKVTYNGFPKLDRIHVEWISLQDK